MRTTSSNYRQPAPLGRALGFETLDSRGILTPENRDLHFEALLAVAHVVKPSDLGTISGAVSRLREAYQPDSPERWLVGYIARAIGNTYPQRVHGAAAHLRESKY